MALWIRPGLTFCLIDGRAIFLDSDGDRYFLLSRERTADFLDLFAAGADAPKAKVLADLVTTEALGDLLPAANISPIRPRAIPKRAVAHRAPPIGLLCRALIRLITSKAKHMVLGESLFRHGLRVRRWANPASRAPLQVDRDELLVAMAYARRLVPFQSNCVVQSFATQCLLASFGMSSDVVIGVRLNPFQAHCWVQHDREVLNDSLEYVGSFTPLAIR